LISVETGMDVSSVNVMTSDDGGHSSEQITNLAMDKIMRVSESAPPAIKEQANVFKENIRNVLFQYIELARQEERATIANRMAKAGQTEMADLVRRI
jgi:formate dehydrogenase maturation protein FdhE